MSSVTPTFLSAVPSALSSSAGSVIRCGSSADGDHRPRRHDRLARGVQDAGPLGRAAGAAPSRSPVVSSLCTMAGSQITRQPSLPRSVIRTVLWYDQGAPPGSVQSSFTGLEAISPVTFGLARRGDQQRGLRQVAGERDDLVGHLGGGDRRAVRR